MPETPDEELVRRLLAEARHDEPMPADVAARLDAVLEGLGARPVDGAHDAPPKAEPDRESGREPDTAPGGASVLPLRRPAAPARRRRWAAALVAAAAVVAGGVALGQLRPSGSNDSAGSAADSSAGGKSAPAESAASGVAELRRATLRADVLRAEATRDSQAEVMPPLSDASFPCAAADWGPGTPVPARLDGVPAMLVLRPPVQGRRVADVLECGTARVLASVTLPAR